MVREAEHQKLNKRGIPVRNTAPPAGFNPYVSAFATYEPAPAYLRGANYYTLQSFALKTAQVSAARARRSAYGDTVDDAIQREFTKMESLGAGPLMPKGYKAPAGTTVLPSFGFVTIKQTVEGAWRKTNWRLVPNGKHQDPANIGETFSATVRLESKLMVAAAFAAAHPNMKFLTFDVTGAFLQCNWRGEELYVRLPKDIPAQTTYMGQTNLAGRVIKVQKAWYGLPESNNIFSNDFKDTIAAVGYVPQTLDTQVFTVEPSATNSTVHEDSVLLMHVDDGMLFYVDDSTAELVLTALRARYGEEMTVTYGQLGTPVSHAGHVFTLHKDYLEIHQRPHIKKCLDVILGPDYATVRPRTTPASKDLFVRDGNATPLNRKEADAYRTQVGMLLYLHTCFDITKEVNWLAGFTQAPTTEHMQKLRKVAQYLKGRLAANTSVRYPRNCPIQLTAWADAAYRVHPDSKSQYGCMVAIHPNAAPFFVKCGKIPGIPVSSYEAEYIALFKLLQRCEYFRQLLRALAIHLNNPAIGPVLVREDNEAVIKLTKVPDIPKRSRHIDVKYHFARHLVKAKHAKLRYLQTELMTADIFTKPLGPKRFAFLRDRLLGRTTTGQDAIED